MNRGYDLPQVVYASPRAQQLLSELPFLESWLPGGEPWGAFYRYERGYLLRFTELGDFEVSPAGTEIIIHAVPGVSSHTVEHLCQNQALPLALSLQKKLVLHGSAVEIGEKAVAFVAESGRGKSTLAASFSSNGFRFLTDDGLFIEKTKNGYKIRPSHPSIRLWDDSREAIALTTFQTAPAIDYNAKTRFLAEEGFSYCGENRTLKNIYFLGDGSSEGVSITPASGQQSFIELRRHCFLLGVDEHEMLAHNFQQLAELSRLPVFFNLDYQRRYEILDQVREAVVKHVHQGIISAENIS
jgi:hypothetical protein